MSKTAGPQRIRGVLADILRDGRERYNQRFTEARRHRSRINPAVFSDFLAETLAPLIDAINTVDPGRAVSAFDGLYDLSLELLGQELVGGRAKYPAINDGWNNLLPLLAKHLSVEPRKVAGAVTNALYNLSQTPGANPDKWMGILDAVSSKVGDVPTLLKVGMVASWCAGLAHFRPDALKELGTLPPDIACVVLGLPSTEAARVRAVLEEMRKDPWLTPAKASDPAIALKKRELKLVKRLGTFKGFGGDFIAPPSVAQHHGQFVVSDGADTWILSADVFGCTLVRHTGAECRPTRHAAHGAAGNIDYRNCCDHFPDLKTVLTAADDGSTLVITVPQSHALYLLAPVKVP